MIISAGCKNSTEPEKPDTDSPADTLSAKSKGHESPDDYIWNPADVISVKLNGSTITVNTNGAKVEGSRITITSAGTYSFSGTLTDGQIVVNTTDKSVVRIILNNASINYSTGAPVYIKSAEKTIVVLAENSVNTLTDGNQYIFENAAVEEPNAALFSKSDLTIFGNGSLKISGRYCDGISSVDGLIIKSGNINVDAADDGIRGKDYLIIRDGEVTVTSKGDGLESDRPDDAAKGYVLVENGKLNITSACDGISAITEAIINNGNFSIISGGGSSRKGSSTISSKGIKGLISVSINRGSLDISSADDALHSNGKITVNDGIIKLSSGADGIHADGEIKVNNGKVSITKSDEGMESPLITINNGNVSLISSDDGFNTTYGAGGEVNDGSCLTINGGNISVNSSRGDGMDSNGNIVMTGGTVVVHGPAAAPEVGADYNGSFNISGGVLVFTGPNSGNMIEATSTSSSQYAVKASTASLIPASTLFHVQDEGGNEILSFKPVRNSYYIVFSSPVLKPGFAYIVFTGGSSTGTDNNGLYTGGTYTPGTQKKSFTISDKVTNVSF